MQNYSNYSQDVFIEQLVKRKKGLKDYLVIVGLVLAYILVIFLVLIFWQYTAFFAPVIIIFLGWGAWLLIQRQNLEYEYICTNGTLDIDVIYNKSRRKRRMSIAASNMEICAPVTDKDYDHYLRQGKYKKMDVTSNTGEEGVWFFSGSYKEAMYLVTFEPDERIIKDLKRHNPRVVKYNAIQG